jgi:hypothetical protein
VSAAREKGASYVPITHTVITGHLGFTDLLPTPVLADQFNGSPVDPASQASHRAALFTR